MLAVYVVLYNGTTLWHTIGLIEIVMTCYGGKSKFVDEEVKEISTMTNQITLMYNSSCNCKGTHRIAILNDIIDRLLEMNAKARRNKRAHKCPLISLMYDSTVKPLLTHTCLNP